MSTPDSPPKRPRLSLQIKAISNGPTVRTSRTLAAAVNPRSPTSFNTLSNVYVTAIGRSTPVASEPLTAIKTTARGQPLKLQTGASIQGPITHVQTPYVATAFPETPLTAQPLSPAVYTEIRFPSTMTATPPLSAGPVDSAVDPKVFTFSVQDTSKNTASATTQTYNDVPLLMSPHVPTRRRTAPAGSGFGRHAAPYTHPGSLHSILRNSPLPQMLERSPLSPRRQSLRLQEKAARRVGYNSPLTQTITTHKYTKSHIDLLCEEASPYSPSGGESVEAGTDMVLDLAMAYTGDETRDGGQTPGPFEEMRRRMAGLAASSPVSSPSGIRKRKRKEKKRRWVWTIGQDEDEGSEDAASGAAIAAIHAAASAAACGIVASPLEVSTPRPGPSRLARSSGLGRNSFTPMPALSIDTLAALAVKAPEEIPTPSIESSDFSQVSSMCESADDVEMSDISSVTSEAVDRGLTPCDSEYDLITPTLTRKRLCSSRLASEDLVGEPGMRRDTPIPADLIAP